MLAEPVEARHPPAKPSDDPRPTPAEDLAAFAPPDPADRVVRLPAAAAVIVGGGLLAIIAVGAIISPRRRRRSRRLPSSTTPRLGRT